MTRPPLLHTVGYQGRDVAGLVDVLRTAGIATLIDVRAVPRSRKPGLSKGQLAHALEAAGIAYLHLGGLGNPKAGREAAKAGRMAEYRRLMAAQLDGQAGQADLRRAAARAAESPSCLMCFEADPGQCHRSLVAERLAETAGFEVRHIPGADAQPSLPLR